MLMRPESVEVAINDHTTAELLALLDLNVYPQRQVEIGRAIQLQDTLKGIGRIVDERGPIARQIILDDENKPVGNSVTGYLFTGEYIPEPPRNTRGVKFRPTYRLLAADEGIFVITINSPATVATSHRFEHVSGLHWRHLKERSWHIGKHEELRMGIAFKIDCPDDLEARRLRDYAQEGRMTGSVALTEDRLIRTVSFYPPAHLSGSALYEGSPATISASTEDHDQPGVSYMRSLDLYQHVDREILARVVADSVAFASRVNTLRSNTTEADLNTAQLLAYLVQGRLDMADRLSLVGVNDGARLDFQSSDSSVTTNIGLSTTSGDR